MALLSVPSISSMPALSKSTSTGESSMGHSSSSSALCTPYDVGLDSISDDFFSRNPSPKKGDDISSAGPLYENGELQTVEISDPPMPKARSLSRAVAKAKRIVQKTLRKGKPLPVDVLERVQPPSQINEHHDLECKNGVGDSSTSMISIRITQDVIRDSGEDEGQLDMWGPGDIRPACLDASQSNMALVLRTEGISAKLESETCLEEFFDGPDSLASEDFMFCLQGPWSMRRFALSALRVFLFLPWCMSVGGAILLSPDHLEKVTFGPGYMPSEQGARRFKYWAHCAGPHIFTFATCICALLWWNVLVGTMVVGAVLARSAFMWGDFRIDLSVPLGEDDRQSVFLAVTGRYLEEGIVMRVRRGPTRMESE